MDPLTITYEQVDKLNLKITNETRFILEVEYNYDSPKMMQAMQNLNLTRMDFERKHYDLFKMPDEDSSFTFQRYYLHLHQIADKKKQLVKERNRIKKEEQEYQQSEMKSRYTHTEYTLQPVEDILERFNRKINLQKAKQEREEIRMKNRIRASLEDGLKQYSVNQIKLKEDVKKIDKLKNNQLKSISDRAHEFNLRTKSILRNYKDNEKQRINQAIEKHKQISQDQKYDEINKQKSKIMEEQKLKEEIMSQKQKLAELRVQVLKRQEMEKCTSLLQKIQNKMQKSDQIRQNAMSHHSHREYSSSLKKVQSNELEQQQKLITNYIVRHKKLNKRSKSQISIHQNQNLNHNSRSPSQQKSNLLSKNNSSQYIFEDQYTQSRRKSVNIIPMKHQKSKSAIDLEKLRIDQNTKLQAKQSDNSLLNAQIELKKQQLSKVNQSNFQLKQQELSILDDIVKIKQNVSKSHMLKQLQKWNVPDLIDKYLK